MNQKKGNLLEEIQDIAQFKYLSDLHVYPLDDRTKEKILQIDESKYSLEEWTDALFYITGIKAYLPAIQEIKELLAGKE